MIETKIIEGKDAIVSSDKYTMESEIIFTNIKPDGSIVQTSREGKIIFPSHVVDLMISPENKIIGIRLK